MYFVRDHVVQLLIVDYTHEDVCNKLLASCTVIEDLAACMAESQLDEILANFIWTFICEWSAVNWFASGGRALPCYGFDELTYGHS
jgi:hypothetical protein